MLSHDAAMEEVSHVYGFTPHAARWVQRHEERHFERSCEFVRGAVEFEWRKLRNDVELGVERSTLDSGPRSPSAGLGVAHGQ